MRSTLETIAGRFDHAVFTTYAVNLRFFEDWVLPLLRACGVRNVVVFVDEAQLGAALEDRSLRSLGRSYYVVSTRLGPGAFHPKLILLSGSESSRACISSANLTVDGQLRKVESALLLDSTEEEHLAPLSDVGTFLRRISEVAPAHAADAILAALAEVPEVSDDLQVSRARVVHNLDRPLLNTFPEADLAAVSPFADSGIAATALSDRGQLEVIVDGSTFAAPPGFFTGAWSVLARDFGKRRLHGKAYWSTSDGTSWLLLGSPNLSYQALLETAANGNTELAVVLEPHEPRLPDPPGTPWDDTPIEQTAPRRHALRAEPGSEERESGASFNAWEDEGTLVTSGVSPEASLDYWDGLRWRELGRLSDGRMDLGPELRPYLICHASERGPIAQAIVHRTEQLRVLRLKPQATSRAADVVSRLPFDLEGVRALEAVLADLYLLGELGEEAAEELARRGRPATGEPEPDPGGLTEWMPARPQEEPRVPDIYRRAWASAPDALIAMIRQALRLDRSGVVDERDLREELLDLDADNLEDARGVTTDEPEATEPVAIDARVLRRYRKELVKLFERGVGFVNKTPEPALADLAFQIILRLHEKIEELEVEVDGDEQTLVEQVVLLQQKLALLEAYLKERGGRDPQCLATARVHLAACIAERGVWEPAEWERLERLANQTAVEILAFDAFAREAAEDAGVLLEDITARLQPYADRAQWPGYFIEADRYLDYTEFGTVPIPWVRGTDWFEDLLVSPAWRVIGYGAVVGYAESRRYAVVVENENNANLRRHILLCDPANRRLYEGFERQRDGHWLLRVYSGVSEGMVDYVRRIGPEALNEASRSEFMDIGEHGLLDGPLREIGQALDLAQL